MPAKKASRPATQDDLKKAETSLRGEIKAVKCDLQRVETTLKGEIGRLDGSIGRLDHKIDRVAIEVVNTNDRSTKLEASLREEMTRNTDRILSALDRHAQTSEAKA